jgi:putative RecB family exonuclease
MTTTPQYRHSPNLKEVLVIKLTPSRIREYQACPLQFKLKYLDALGPKDIEQSPAFSFGCSMHAALDVLHRPGRSPKQITLEALLRRTWKNAGYADAQQETQYFAKGVDALTRYFQTMGTPQGKIIGTETFFSRVVNLDGHRFELGCKADRVELLPDGALEILDYKTNGNGEILSADALAADLPTFIYYTLARLSYPQHPRAIVSQLNVLTLSKSVVDYTADQIAENKQALANLVAEIEAGQFEPRPNGHCAWCPVRSYCPFFGPEVSLDQAI